MPNRPDEVSGRVRIWDLPVRLFHWALVALIATAWWSAEQRVLDWHRLAGYSILTLILFRVLWGLFGSTTARFSHFLRGPRGVAAYIRESLLSGRPSGQVGHNPLGGWSVVVMLLLLLAQTMLGMIAVDVDGLESGPFSYLVSFETGRSAAAAHELLFNVLLAIIALHVLAIIFYAVRKRDNLITPMIVGSRPWTDVRPSLHFAPLWRALFLFGVSALLVWGSVEFLGQI